jgi:hypothetical protein
MNNLYSEILKTAFEQIDGRWIWYANAWSGGVVVSSDERDLYLSFSPLAFRKAISGRLASYPRRSYWPTLKRMLVTVTSGRDEGTAHR